MKFVIDIHLVHPTCLRFGSLALSVVALLVNLLVLPVTLRAQATCPTPYLVQPGDGWFKIANKCGVPYPALRDANRELWQRQGEMLYVGDQLQMPQFPFPTSTPGSTPSPVPNATPTATPIGAIQNPRETVRFFWLAVIEGLRHGDLRAAYAYLGPQLQRALPFPTFSAGFAATKEITIESIVTIQEDAVQAVVDAVIIAAEQAPSGWQYRRQRYRYTLVLINGQWRFAAIDNLGGDPTNSCPNTVPTRLQRGARAYVLPQPPTPNRVFREPNRQSPLVGRIYPGEAMTLVDGPRCAQQSVWWYVQADTGVIGWTAEGQPGEYWLAPVVSIPPTDQPQVGPITFCATVDRANRCPAPTTQFPIGLKRIEVNWSFQNLPIGTNMIHVWYHNGKPFFTRPHVQWEANRSSPTGLGYTFYAPLGGLPTGAWWLEFRRQSDNQLLQRASFYIGPVR